MSTTHPTLFELVRSDYRVAGMRPTTVLAGLLTLAPFWLVCLYRLSHWLHCKRLPLLPAVIRSVGVLVFGADLSPAACIGPSFGIVHGVGIVLGYDVIAGSRLTLCQNSTVGGRGHWDGDRWTPTLGDGVFVGAGAAVLGPIVIGDNVSIGANAVVIRPVRSNSIAVGNPCRLIERGPSDGKDNLEGHGTPEASPDSRC